MEVFKTKNATETGKLGLVLGRGLRGDADQFTTLLRSNVVRGSALVLELFGELGSGKTTFLKGLGRGLRIKERIISPTYIFARSYNLPSFRLRGQIKNKFYHLDLYRLDGLDPKILNSFEFQEIIKDPSAIVAIEWAQRLNSLGKKIKPSLIIEFVYTSASGRDVKYKG